MEEDTGLIGREAELATIGEFLASRDGPRVLVTTGVAGIGKTTLWEKGLELARAGGARVLHTRAGEAETRLSFAGLADLLGTVEPAVIDTLAPPQRYALEVALRRTAPDSGPPEELAVSLGLLGILTSLAGNRPVVVAVDDIQWLDKASADVLAFAIRRLQNASLPVAFLFAQRSGTTTTVLGAVGNDHVERLVVEPLSVGAVRRILFERLGLSLTRRALHRVFDTAQGNPLFALELGRAIVDRGIDVTGDALALPDDVEQLLGTRVSLLPPVQRRLLVAVAVCSTLRPEELAAVGSADAVERGADAGVLVIERDHVRAAHPLLAAAALEQAPARERRAIFRALAGAVSDEQLHARLLAGATSRPDAAIADQIAAAAAGAELTGAFDDAVQLAGHALRLTPASRPERPGRVVLFGRLLAVNGQPNRTVELLVSELDTLPRGPRTEALLGLASEVTDPIEVRRYLDQALRESPDDPGVRAAARAILSLREAVIELRDVTGAEARLAAELEHAASAGPELELEILINMLWINALRGRSVAETVVRFPLLPSERLSELPIPEMIDAQRLFWRGEIAGARDALVELMARAELGARFYALNRLYLCDLELRCGNWGAAERLLNEWDESSDDEQFVWPMYERCRAQLAAGRGLVDETERWAAETIERADVTGEGWNRLEAVRARGVAALVAGPADTAIASLRAVWEHTQREGIDEPGVFPVAPDLVEALCEAGALDEARAVTTRLSELAEQQAHPWARLATSRCDALLGIIDDDESAFTDLATVADAYAARGLHFDHARCLLTLGRAERRRRRWAAARDSLERAASAFAELGSSGWAEEARSELGRISARRPAQKGELTPSEERTAALAAQGLANKEIAATLHVTTHTVEVHLSRAYAKLGVRSRTQLAALLLTDHSP